MSSHGGTYFRFLSGSPFSVFAASSCRIISSLPDHFFPPRLRHSHSCSAASSYVLPMTEFSSCRNVVPASSGGKKV